MDNTEYRATIDRVIGAQLERVIERRQWSADFEERTVMWLVGIGAAALGLFIAKPFDPTFLRYFGLVSLSLSIASGVISRLVMREALSLELRIRQSQRKKLNETPMTFATNEEAQHFLGMLAKRSLEVDLWDEPAKPEKSGRDTSTHADIDLEATNKKLADQDADERAKRKRRWLSLLPVGKFLFDACLVMFLVAETTLLLSILFDR